MRKQIIKISLIAATTLASFSQLNATNLPLNPKVEQKSIKYAPNEVIIRFKKNTKIPESFYKLLKKFKTHKYQITNAMHVKSKTLSTKELIKLFSDKKFKNFILNVKPNYIYGLQDTNDKYFNKLWAIKNVAQEVNGKKGTKDADMDVDEAWNLEKGDPNVIVAILDTGVDYTHNDLADNMYRGLSKHGYDFAGDDDGNNDDDPMPDKPYDERGHYHGTHVAGTVGAVGDNSIGVTGVAQNIQIMAVKVFRPNGYAYQSDILEGLDFVSKRIDKGDNIVAINASYGGGGGSQDDATNDAIKNLGKKGVVFCAAAGNDSKNIDYFPTYPASYDAPNIITVAASDQDDKLASFSNYGKKSVDVAAPGTNIYSTYPGNKYKFLQGTSMATPQVTGSVALLASYFPESSVSERINLIEKTVDKKSNLANKVKSGGRVNINRALHKDENPNQPPIANDDKATTKYETKVIIDVLKNDSDPDGDNLIIQSVTQPSHGSVKIVNSKIEYTPDNNYSGTDNFNYTIIDNRGGKDSAKVTVTVKEKNSGGLLGSLFGTLFGGLF